MKKKNTKKKKDKMKETQNMGGWSSRPVKANYDERDLSH